MTSVSKLAQPPRGKGAAHYKRNAPLRKRFFGVPESVERSRAGARAGAAYFFCTSAVSAGVRMSKVVTTCFTPETRAATVAAYLASVSVTRPIR